MNMAIELLAIGGAHIDRTATMLEAHIPGASNPVSFSQNIGGGALNALRVAKIQGIDGIAMIAAFIDRTTPSYTAIINVDGELVTALADMELYDFGFERQVRRKEGRDRIAESKAILVDANLPEEAVKHVCAHASAMVFGMCISPAKAKRLLSSANKIDLLFLNQAELAALTNKKKEFADLGFKRAVITNGAQPVQIFDNGKIKKIKVPHASWISDVTGAGDALVGGTIAALLTEPNKPLANCVMEGIACCSIMKLQYTPDVETALRDGAPVVALESTIVTHGMPYPDNLEMARSVETIIRNEGAVPATIAVIEGAFAMIQRATGGTTVAATMMAAHAAGIGVFATGGIGGVHKGAEQSFDISADLDELSRTPVTVVSAGAKAILDIPKTMEALETRGVPVIAYGQDALPAFWSRESGLDAPLRLESAQQIAALMDERAGQFNHGGILITNPVPSEFEIPFEEMSVIIDQAQQQADSLGISGKAVTPWLLGYGFIAPDDGSKDVFVHATALERAGINGLAEGQKVNFETDVDQRSGKTAVSEISAA
ncbi:Pseudouridine-5'-phosphate glycosidase [Nymphon striatum]|nr:Pseudouridine-5'-phosphate glycosidase [Nymphon striatum]